MDKLAIVILNWNGSAMLRRFLPDVLKYSSQEGHVYVADNGSTDDSLVLLAEEFPQVDVIELKQNYGFAEGYNQALSRIDATYYLLLNSDVAVGEAWLTPLLSFMDKHTEVAACQPKLRSLHQPDSFEYAGASGGYLDALGYPYCRGRIFDTVEADAGQYDDIVSVFWATGAALMVRSEAYWQVNGLDARFFAHMEEIDFCWRLRSRGYMVACIPASVVYHVGGGTLPKENPRKTYLNFRNNLLMLYKNLPAERLESVMRWRVVLDAVASCVFLLKGEWRSFSAVWKARSDYRKMKKALWTDRVREERERVLPVIPEQTPYSILSRYYLHGERRYADLDKK